MSEAREAVKLALKNALRFLVLKYGYPVDYTFKAKRDTREPGRIMKLATERKLTEVFTRIFKKQAGKVRDLLEREYPDRKAVQQPHLTGWEDIDPDDEAELLLILTDGAKNGVKLFGEQVGIGFDYVGANTRASEWVRKYLFDLIKDITETTRKALQSVIGAFIETPGMTIGDMVKQLPFDPERALTIAVTETTRAYAQGNREGAAQLQNEWPDVKVTRTWFANNDDIMCVVCGALDGQETGADEPFKVEIDGETIEVEDPPGHPHCRCWTSYGTKL